MVLVELNKQIRDSRETARKIKGAMMYPIILICFAIGAVTAMLWFVIPTFAGMFKDLGADCRGSRSSWWTSRATSSITAFMSRGLVIVALAVRKFAKTETGRRCFVSVGVAPAGRRHDRPVGHVSLRLEHLPAAEKRHSHVGNASVLEGVFQTSPPYRDALARVQTRVSPAARWPLAGRDGPVHHDDHQHGPHRRGIGPIVPGHGATRSLLQRKNRDHDQPLTKLLEPFIIVGMGSTVAGLMLSIYLPMFEMAGKVH